MNDIMIALLLIIGFFLAGLVVKKIFSWKFCAICTAVSGTWLSLLGAFLLGFYANAVVIAILMGQSVIGLYSLLEKRLDERFSLFRLPYILTGTIVVYTLIEPSYENGLTWLIVLGVWLIFGTIYLMRTNEKVKGVAEHIIACCRDW